MYSIRPVKFAFLVCLALAAGFATAGNEAHAVQAAAGLQLAQNDWPTLRQAIEQVRRQYRGRIIDAETRMRGNREVHVIKVLTEDGKVKTVRIPGRTRGSRG